MIGVGKLGQDCAEVMLDAGNDVVGYDVEPRRPKFEMKDTIEDAVKGRDLIFIAAPTPHNPIYGGETPTSHLPNKDFDYTIVTNILQEVNKHVNKSQLVVLISTVLPGTVRSLLEPCITNARFIYNPYLIAMGTIKWDMVNPEMVIIGTEDGSITGDASELIDFYNVFMQNNPRYEVGTWDEAEAIKIFYNTFISTKIALVNMVQDVAETNGNMNVDVVTTALAKSTHRIMGPAYMKAALGDAGACHPRDNIALRYLADRLDLGYDLFDSIMTAREVQAKRMALRCLKNGTNITIIGKAYKPNVPYTNGSASMLVGHYIEQYGGKVNYYDVHTGDNDLKQDWTHVYLIGYWDNYVKQISLEDPAVVVIDPWRQATSKLSTGEIIHYGDTRKKDQYVQLDADPDHLKRQTLLLWPDLKKYEDQIHVIDATINFEFTFIMRPTELIIEDIRKQYKQGKTKFLFYACTEAVMPHVISKIQRIASILRDEIPTCNFFYLSGTNDGPKVYDRIAQSRGWLDRISIMGASAFEFYTQHYAYAFDMIGPYEVKLKEKKFLCFNKVNREHRMRLLEMALENNIVKDGFYSFEGDEQWLDLIPKLKDTEYPNIKKNKDIFPLRLNITPERTNPVNIIPEDLYYHRESYFSIVTETLFYGNGNLKRHHQPFVEDSIFFTEKTFRCMALMHPFILFGRPGSLDELRKKGYQTFSPMIDESYDKIEDDEERFFAIWGEIYRLIKQTDEEWLQWQEQIRDIVVHNKIHFRNTTNYNRDNVDVLMNNQTINSRPIVSEPIVNVVLNPSDEPMPLYTTEIIIQDDVKLMPLLDNVDWTLQNITLAGGIDLQFPTHLDGGGIHMKPELMNVIRRYGKQSYERAFEWCSGPGFLGYEILGSGVAKHIVFSDYYPVALDNCLDTARKHNLTNSVTAHLSATIAGIPDVEKWDLVVSNPPHTNNKENFINGMLNENREHSFLDNTCRLLVDQDWLIHQEFFRNIRKKLTDDADVFLIEAGTFPIFLDWADAGGLKFMGKYSMNYLPHGGIFHFKLK